LNFYCDNKEVGCVTIRYVYQDNGTNSFLKSAGKVSRASTDLPPVVKSATSF
jgi:hypothetical protein